MKRRHLSRSLERHVGAPREHTWKVLHDSIEQAADGYVLEGDPAPHGAGAVLHLKVPRMAEHLGLQESMPTGALVETVLSYEPPWRRAYSVTGAVTGLDLYHGTFVLRDDGPECHLSWGVVADPEPSPQGLVFLDFAVATVDGLLDRVVAAAERLEPRQADYCGSCG